VYNPLARFQTFEHSLFSRQKGAGTADYTAPLNFVAGGIQQSGKNKEKAKSDISDEG
jgi:Tuftelin interacting protein N terminal